jgi:hypothetical protein
MRIASWLTSALVDDPRGPGEGRIRPLVAAHAYDRVVAAGSTVVVLAEGVSDVAALEALAARRGRDLDGEGVAIVAMGGATNLGHFLAMFGPEGLGATLAGLCDEGEESGFRRGLERAGLGRGLTRAGAERLGFFVCVADLEDELIRSLGVAAVEQVAESQGELGSFRTFQKQPAHRGQPTAGQLRYFMGTHSGRKAQYARLLVEAMDLSRVPRPLERLLAHVEADTVRDEMIS